MNKRVTAIGLTAGLLAGAGAGFVLEHSSGAGAAARPIDLVAANGNVNANANENGNGNGLLGSATLNSSLASILQPLVDNGTLTPDQLQKVIAALQNAGVGDGGRGGDAGRGGDGGGREGRGRFGMNLDAVSTLLNMSVADLRAAMQNGQTLAQIATAHNKTAQDVIDVLVAAVKAHFAPEVASGEHTQAEADQMIAGFTQRITDFVNNGGGIGRGPHDDSTTTSGI